MSITKQWVSSAIEVYKVLGKVWPSNFKELRFVLALRAERSREDETKWDWASLFAISRFFGQEERVVPRVLLGSKSIASLSAEVCFGIERKETE